MKVDFRLGEIKRASYNNAAFKNVSRVDNFDVNNYRSNNYSRALVFCGNSTKNMSQVASIAPEYQGVLNELYKLGGLGNVAGEAAVAFQDKGDMDFRTFVPYYCPDNYNGGLKVKTPLVEGGEQVFWQEPKIIQGKQILDSNNNPVFEKVKAYEFKAVPADYVLKEGEDFVIHEAVTKSKPTQKAAYKILNDTGIKGFVETIDDNIEGMVKTPYRVFSLNNTGAGLKNNPPVYFIHTPGLAKFPRAYGSPLQGAYAGAYGGSSFDDALYSIFSKSAIDAMPKLNDEKFGNFNPGNFWLHDRQAFPSLLEISEKSSQNDDYWRGIRAHSSYHNPGRDYQGHYRNPIDFLRITGTKRDLEELQKNPSDYEFVKQMARKIESTRQDLTDVRFSPEEILTKEEFERLDNIFKPLFGNFIDETGEYNLCEIPIAGVKKNPFNFSAGTVSTNYGKEMKNHNTKEIAKGLTRDFASIPTVDIVNGSSAKSMGLDVIGNFGKDNGFTPEIKAGFTPLTKEITADCDLLFKAKQDNKKWFIDTVADASKKGKDALNHLFFGEKAINEGASVLGEFTPYKKGDVLFISWGRPDTQKGFPTTLEGFLQFLKDDKIESPKKEHAKFLISAGPWQSDSTDWKTIQKQMDEIISLEGGKYKGNICYLNGFFTSRIVACADYTNITSRYEPCGITPLESFAGATPVISNNTGGSPDFIKPLIKGKSVENETGFLTKNAYLVNPEVLGADKNLSGAALDEARRLELGRQNASCISDAMDLILNKPDEYKKMMMNAQNSKIDWFENAAFNSGKSALERYKENAWLIDSNNMELTGQVRNIEPLESLKGIILKSFDYEPKAQEVKDTAINFTGALNESAKKTKNKYLKAFVGIIALGALGAWFIQKKIKKDESKKPDLNINQKPASSATTPNINDFAKMTKK